MDDVRTPVAAPSLYEADEYAWYFVQIAALREGRLHDLDVENLAEFLEDMARREVRELESRLKVLLQHLLKLRFQPARYSRSWFNTIDEQQDQLRMFFRDSATMERQSAFYLARAYPRALRKAAAETGLPLSGFPAESPWTIEEALAFELPTPPGGRT